MQERTKNILLYGSGGILAALLVYGGFIYPATVEADPGTKLAIAEFHLKFAEAIPEMDRDGAKVEVRSKHIREARKILAEVERAAPGLAITAEFGAYASWIEGDMSAAEAGYREVLKRAGSDEGLRNRTWMNIAQVLHLNGKPEKARRVLAKVPSDSRDCRWHLLSAKTWQALGDTERRDAEVAKALKAAGNDLDLKKYCSAVISEWSHAAALSCLEALENKDAEVWYRIALLKVENGDFDNGRDALERSNHADPRRFSILMNQDREFWERQGGRGFKSRFLEKERPASPSK